MKFLEKIKTAQAITDAVVSAGEDVASKALEPLVPMLREQAAKLRATNDAVTDEDIAHYSEVLHEALPLPVRLVVRKEKFSEWCVLARDRIFPVTASESAAAAPSIT